ncbi:hypothetical protein TNCT_351101 [Trichonephila clavata]|uniref:Uncharacterized protein n=1 Tax=Trichonephila clavata TaxID=2740835 RepID=A0A8X6FLW3_TRICU|nr:hypothetical protein TNCT_351101 [Trichonephila clavata]
MATESVVGNDTLPSLPEPDINDEYTLTGKRTEIIVKKIINNLPHRITSVKNPDSFKCYYDIPELKGF